VKKVELKESGQWTFSLSSSKSEKSEATLRDQLSLLQITFNNQNKPYSVFNWGVFRRSRGKGAKNIPGKALRPPIHPNFFHAPLSLHG